MSQINVKIDLFCAGCGKGLLIEDSAGSHVLVTPCFTCIETKVDQAATKVRYEEGVADTREESREKLRKWNEDAEARKKELVNVDGGE